MIKSCLHTRSSSYDSALYFKEKGSRRHHSHCATSLNRDHADDRTVFEENEEKFYFSSCLNYLEEIYTKHSPAITLQNKGNTARDHLGKRFMRNLYKAFIFIFYVQ